MVTEFTGSPMPRNFSLSRDKMSNVVVKLFTRPVVGADAHGVEVNPKLDYPPGTVFYLRWLPKRATNYRVKSRALL